MLWYTTAPGANRFVAAAALPDGSLVASGFDGPEAVVHKFGDCVP